MTWDVASCPTTTGRTVLYFPSLFCKQDTLRSDVVLRDTIGTVALSGSLAPINMLSFFSIADVLSLPPLLSFAVLMYVLRVLRSTISLLALDQNSTALGVEIRCAGPLRPLRGYVA